MIHFFFCVVFAQGQAQAAVGHIMHPADGQQHMAGIQRAGGAGGAGGGTHALHIQQEQQALALDALKAEAHIAGKAVYRIAVESAVGDLAQTLDQLIPQSGDLGGIGVHVGAGFFQRRGHAHDGRQIFRAGTLAPLLCAALDHIGQREATAAVQSAHALGAVELVAGQAQHVDVLFLHMDLQMTHRLDRVGVEGNARLLAYRADLGDGQHGADLVVGVHTGDQTGVLADGVLHLLRGDVVALGNIQQRHLEAFLFQLLQRVQHCVMLKGGGDDVQLSLALTQAGSGNDGLVVRLAAAGGEVDLPGLAAQTGGDGRPGGFQLLLGLLADAMEAGGVAVVVFKAAQHSLQGGAAHFCGSRVVGINLHIYQPFRYLPSNSVGNIPLFTYFVNG